MRTNHVKAQLKSGQPSYGAWLSIPSLETARAIAHLGFDWLLVDCEHTPFSPDLMSKMVAVIAEVGGPAPLVRVPSKRSEEWFKWALDAGAWGVVVPYVNNRAEALQAVEWCKYPPEGKRSFGSVFGPHGYGTTDRAAYFNNVNRETLVVLQIETTESMENLEGILSVPGVDVAFVGPNDLHLSMGLPPSNEGAEPEFEAAMQQIRSTAQKYGVATGIFTSGGKAAAKRVQEGFGMVVAMADHGTLVYGAQSSLNAAKGG